MFKEGYSFPHPVLGNDDDVHGEFNVALDLAKSSEKKVLVQNVHIEVTNDFISGLVTQGAAQFIIKLYCSSTFTTWILDAPFSNIEIDENELVNKVDVQAFIVATNHIPSYKDDSFHSQFLGQAFTISSGEIIGISSKVTLQLEKQHEKLGLGNIFKFCQHEHDKPIHFEHNRDKIYINYPVTMKGLHPPRALFEKKPWAAFNIFIIPALSEALRFIADKPDEVKELEWYQVIDNLLPESERNDNYFIQAQQILNKELPVLLAFDELIE